MLHTTFKKLKENNACVSRYRKFAICKGGVKRYGQDTPIPLTDVLDVCGLRDALWCLRCTIEPPENILIEFACRCAEHVLHFYEDEYPDDKRPRQAIETARACITDKSAWAARAAGDAAWDAGDAARAAWAAGDAAEAAWAAARAAWAARAAGDAARAAGDARAAAWAAWAAAEAEWQSKVFKELLEMSL